MCQPLSNALDDFLGRVGIDKNKDLFYYWPKDSRAKLEDAVCALFKNDFHPRLITALREQNDDTLLNGMNEILVWGGIVRRDRNDHDAYANELSDETYDAFKSILKGLYDCWNERGLFDKGHLNVRGEVDIDDIGTISYDCPVCEERTPLSSWTKILAAFDMRRFWIYDSRVAIALSFMYAGEYNWYIPEAHNAEALALTAFINGRRGEGNMEESYSRYLNLLRGMDHGTPQRRSSYEKKLFMLGGILTDYFTMTRKINNENNISSFVNHFF